MECIVYRVAYYNEILHITMARLLQMLTHVRSSHSGSVQVVRSAHQVPGTMGPVTTHTRGDLTHDMSLIMLSNPRCSPHPSDTLVSLLAAAALSSKTVQHRTKLSLCICFQVHN